MKLHPHNPAIRWLPPILLATIAATVIGGYYFGTPRLPVKLEVAAADLELGQTWTKAGLNHKLPIHNPTSNPISVVRFETSCHCTAIIPAQITIPPGAIRIVHAEIDLTGRQSRTLSGNGTNVQIDITAVSSEQANNITWRLSGVARRPFQLFPARLELPLCKKWEAFRDGQALIRLAPGITNLEASCNPQFGSVEVCPVSPGGGNDLNLIVHPNNSLPVGPFAFDVNFTITTDEGERFQSDILPVQGMVVEKFEALPSDVRFHATSVGALLEQRVIVRSRTNEMFSVQSITTMSEDLDVSCPLDTSSHLHTLTFKQSITAEGSQSRVVELLLHDVDGKLHQLKIQVSYNGLPASRQ
jgi:hypothetical protein